MSTTLLPSRRESSAMASSCSLFAKPLGMRMRIMNLPGVGLRKNTPTHFNNSFSAGVSGSTRSDDFWITFAGSRGAERSPPLKKNC